MKYSAFSKCSCICKQIPAHGRGSLGMDVRWLHRKPQNISCYPQRQSPDISDAACVFTGLFLLSVGGFPAVSCRFSKSAMSLSQKEGTCASAVWVWPPSESTLKRIVLLLLFYHVIIFMMHTNQSSTPRSN